MQYRYLDLRRNPVRKNLELRHQLMQATRHYLDGKEFLRKSRHMSVDQVVEEIKRPYDIMTS